MVAESVQAPPPVVVEGPYGAPPMLAISPDSVMGTVGGSGEPVKPPMVGGGVGGASGAPPPLRRQNASRFSWPPDTQQEWCYINLPPPDLALQCERVLGRRTTLHEIAELFTSPPAATSRAYTAYAERYRGELDQILQQHEQSDHDRPE